MIPKFLYLPPSAITFALLTIKKKLKKKGNYHQHGYQPLCVNGFKKKHLNKKMEHMRSPFQSNICCNNSKNV